MCFLLLGVEARRARARLEALLDPALLRAVGDVHVLDADRAAVGVVQRLQDVAQRRARGADERAGVEHRVHVGFGQAVERRIELGDVRLRWRLSGSSVAWREPAKR